MEIVDPLCFENWDEVVHATEGTTFFHTSAWAKVVSQSYGYTPLYFISRSVNGFSRLIPMMEVRSVVTGKRGVSLPFTDYCPPVVRDRAEIGGVIKEITKVGLARGWKYVEIRDPFMSSNGRKPCSNYVLHSLELGTNEKEVFSRFRASTRRNIRKAVKEGMEVRIGKSLDDLNEFCNLNCLTRKRHGLPPQPKKFFKTLFTEIILAGHGMLYLGLHGGKSIAGAIFVNSGKTAIFKYGASDMQYQHLRANNHVMWEAILSYCRQGYKELVLGRTDPRNKGLIRYKSGWGATERELKYYRFNCTTNGYDRASSMEQGWQNAVFNRMPVRILNLVGRFSYKHMG